MGATGRPFHGPRIAALATAAFVVASPGQTYGISLFVESWIRDIDLSRSELATLYTVATLIGAATMPLFGSAIDRVGVRKVALGVSAGLGLALFATSLARGWMVLLLCLAALRMLGQGALGMCAGNITARWYDRMRGRIVGLTLAIASLLTALYPPIVEWVIGEAGWRWALGALGVWVWISLLPATWAWMVDTPEELGQVPDGGESAFTRVGRAGRPAEESLTLEEAQRDLTFWLLIAAQCTMAFLLTGFAFHQTSILAERGLTESQAAAVWLPHFAAVALGTLLGGWALDRTSPLNVVGIFLALTGCGVLSLMAVAPGPMAWAYGAILGLGAGVSRSSFGVVWAHYFGVTHLGAIQGRSTLFFATAAAAAPLPFAAIHDATGGYGATLWPSFALTLFLALAVVMRRRTLSGRGGLD